jgi:hypothetical protein
MLFFSCIYLYFCKEFNIMKMKYILCSVLLAIFCCTGLTSSFAQIGIGTTTPASGSVLDLNSTNKGFLPPRMTKAQRDAISSPTAGLIVYCSDCNNNSGCLSIRDNSKWYCITDVVKDNYGDPYLPVECGNGRIWLDRNLGAKRAAQAYNDYLAYGSQFQWGRYADGHELINWTSATTGTRVNGTTTTLSSVDNPGHNLFIINNSSPWDWRVPQNNALWQGLSGINNPCPAGYRIPSSSEFLSESATWSPQNRTGAFNCPCRFASAGASSPTVSNAGAAGFYWMDALDINTGVTYGVKQYFDASAVILDPAQLHYQALSVRCIKD